VAEHPIQGLMKTAMENIRDMIDVNTIVGEPVETPDGGVIVPISRVGFGFAAGGSEFPVDGESGARDYNNGNGMINGGSNHPFGGGSGGGVSITPIAFLVVGKQGVKVVPLDYQTHLVERMIESVPKVIDKIQYMIRGTEGNASISGGNVTIQSEQTNVTV